MTGKTVAESIAPGANLRGANLCGADLCGANLRTANLDGANLSTANLRAADLRGANLRGGHLLAADLYGANLRGANLRATNLCGANLRTANLDGANLSTANLRAANLSTANLRAADLRGANLRGANLRATNLCGADLDDATRLPHFQIPQHGSLVVYKALRSTIATLEVPPEARRTATPAGRKCRAEWVRVVALEPLVAGAECPKEDVDRFAGSLVYRPGEEVHPNAYDDDIRVGATHGIHFFLTREEAEEY